MYIKCIDEISYMRIKFHILTIIDVLNSPNAFTFLLTLFFLLLFPISVPSIWDKRILHFATIFLCFIFALTHFSTAYDFVSFQGFLATWSFRFRSLFYFNHSFILEPIYQISKNNSFLTIQALKAKLF